MISYIHRNLASRTHPAGRNNVTEVSCREQANRGTNLKYHHK